MKPELRAMLGFLEVMTLHPEQLTPAHVRAVLDAGVRKAAMRDATYVCALFCTITRLADVLRWDVPEEWQGSRDSLVKFGYKLPPFL